MKVQAHVIFTGKVQGVWFRANTQKKAKAMGLTGWVRNLPDGSVEAVFQGPEEQVKATVQWCETSQPYARVDSVEVKWMEYTGEFQGFDIR